jgi:hypothetical protein
MSRRGPRVYVTVDADHDIALLRGDGARDVILSLALEAPWSTGGRGWVVDAGRVADVVALCEHRHQLCVVSNRRPPEQVAS